MPIWRLGAAGFWFHLFRATYVACSSIIIKVRPVKRSRLLRDVSLDVMYATLSVLSLPGLLLGAVEADALRLGKYIRPGAHGAADDATE